VGVSERDKEVWRRGGGESNKLAKRGERGEGAKSSHFIRINQPYLQARKEGDVSQGHNKPQARLLEPMNIQGAEVLGLGMLCAWWWFWLDSLFCPGDSRSSFRKVRVGEDCDATSMSFTRPVLLPQWSFMTFLSVWSTCVSRKISICRGKGPTSS
jgi:hypothetical protein